VKRAGSFIGVSGPIFRVDVVRDCRGASAAEYALILGILGAALAIAALTLGSSISNSIDRSGNEILNCGGGC
jgi:pilus assembly protein Flp/PilA